MRSKKLIIVGIGEIAKNAYEYFTFDSTYEVVAFSVTSEYLHSSTFLNLPVIPFETIENVYPADSFFLFIALGESLLNRQRRDLYDRAKSKGYSLASYISSKASVWNNVLIGDNCFILPQNVLEPFVKIGNNVILWSGNHIGHSSVIKDNCFITSHVVISGFCEIGENCFIGVNSCFAAKIKVAKYNFIAMGAVVNKNTKEDSFYCGNPAKNQNISAKKYFESIMEATNE